MTEHSWHHICSLEDLKDGLHVGKIVKRQALILYRNQNDVFAYEDRCPHAGAPLSDGRMRQNYLTCRHHQWQFDLRTGESLRPRGSRLKSYPIKTENGEVFVSL